MIERAAGNGEPTTTYDVIVLGLGVIGAAAADQLALKGHRVLGLEQFGALHDRGSSHGETRAIRKAYFEDARYVPLMIRAYELWAELETSAKQQLLVKSGCVIMGPETSVVLRGGLASAKQFYLPHEILNSSQLRSRYGFTVSEDTQGFLEPDGGYLKVEACIEAFHTRAREHGADLRFNTKVESFEATPDRVEVKTATETFTATKLVLALGAWSPKVINEPLTPKRAIQFWFDAPTGEELPVFFHDTPGGRWIYGFPKIGDTIKVAFHNALETTDPETINRAVSQDEVETISKPARALLPKLGNFKHAKTCLYTMTPDEHFTVGEIDHAFVATGFSGHGFKFAPVIGEILSDLIEGRLRDDIGLFAPDRFRRKTE